MRTMVMKNVCLIVLVLLLCPALFAVYIPSCLTGQTLINGVCVQQYTLTVSPNPPNGLILNDDQSLRCGYDGSSKCSITVNAGTVVHVGGYARTGYGWAGWTGACGGTGACYITMDANKSVSANFPIVETNTFTMTPPTGGTIRFKGGVTCPSTCSYSVSTGERNTFDQTAALGYVFGAWGEACAGQGAQCVVSVNSNITVSASFNYVGTYTLTISPFPSNGLVLDDDQSLRCGYDGSNRCSVTVTKGTQQHLAGSAAPGHGWGGWTGACSGTGACYITMDGNKTASAVFP
jgi:hypothetical protein